jgi:3-phenylpropionate/trans-cinnamate dioxygenase ferredoxin subunit
MGKHVVGLAAEIPPGGRKTVEVRGRPIVIFNHDGAYYALLDRCPHSGARLSRGILTDLVRSKEPGVYECSLARQILKCPWHGWEFDITTGRSWCDPAETRVRRFPVEVRSGAALEADSLVAETFQVEVEDRYLVIEL